MRAFARSHLSDDALLTQMSLNVSRENTATVEVVADIAEVDLRRLYLPAGYPSMFAFCTGHFRLSEDAAYKRIQVARSGRKFPAILEALAEGRVHLTGLGMLATHLTPENVDELLAAATHRSKADIEMLLAERFPRPDVPTRIRPLPSAQPAPAQVGASIVHAGEAGVGQTEQAAFAATQLAPAQVGTDIPELLSQAAPAQVLAPTARVSPLSTQRFELRATIRSETRDLLRRAQELLGHAVPSGDVDEVLHRALTAYVDGLERQKFAAADRPRGSRRRAKRGERHVPADVQRAVWARDDGRCTFVGTNGHRCAERTRLEFDHIEPVSRGGRATVQGIRLRCRAHNQYEAERLFGREFMQGKREAARRTPTSTLLAHMSAARGP